MIESRLLSAWDGLIGSVALLAVIILALCVMVGAVKQEYVLRHLSLVVGIVALLIMLPAIFVGLWNALSFGQQFGIMVVFFAIILFASEARRRRSSERNR